MLNILRTLEDPQLFQPWFDGHSWTVWKTLLKVVFGLELNESDWETFRKLTGRQTLPTRLQELWVIAGRRSGKSKVAALIAVFLACFRDWRQMLKPGEKPVIAILACDKEQAQVIYTYIKGFLENIEILKPLVQTLRQDDILLTNGVGIEIRTSSFRRVRGRTVVCAICDEIAFWFNENSANPDKEVLTALKPSLATIPDSLLLCISTPYSRRGELWKTYQQHFGKERETRLVVKGATRDFNETISQELIDESMLDDPAAALAEWGGQFRTDVESFVSLEAIESCIIPNRIELPPIEGVRYRGFCDPAGGSGQDAMTLAVGHREADRLVIDAIRERKPPFNPSEAVKEFCDLLKHYRVSKVMGDRYAGEWPRERFREHGVTYEPAAKPKSDLYRDALPLLNSGQAELLDIDRLKAQLSRLERRTARGGRDSIDHAPGSHDDLSNSVAGLLVELAAAKKGKGFMFTLGSQAELLEPTHPENTFRDSLRSLKGR